MWRVTLTLTALFLVTPAWAADLQGAWALDMTASDSLDPLLKAQGVSWVKRKAINGMKMTQTIARTGDQVTLKVDASAGGKEETLLVDGQTRTVEADKGPLQVTHRWDGDALVTTQEGALGTVTTWREASDDGTTLTQRITLQKTEGEAITIHRIFRKL